MTIGTAGLEDPRGAAVTVWNYSLRRQRSKPAGEDSRHCFERSRLPIAPASIGLAPYALGWSSVQIRYRVESRSPDAEKKPVTDRTFMNLRGPQALNGN